MEIQKPKLIEIQTCREEKNWN